MKQKDEGQIKPTKCALIVYFYLKKKHNKSVKNDVSSNRCDGFAEDIEIENTQHKKKVAK